MNTTIYTKQETLSPHSIERAATSYEYPSSGYEPKKEEARHLDKRVNLKLDFAVVLILAIDFVLCGIDKTNIGYIATTNMLKDANLTQDDIADSVSILSVTYITLQPFSTAIGRRVGPKYWIACMTIAWGSVCMAHAAIKNRGTLIALRLLLGAFEAGFAPTSFYYMSTLYPKYLLGLRMRLFAGIFSIAGAFAGLIAYGIFMIKDSSLHNWQWLFIIEGALSLVMAAVTVTVLPAKLESAWFLTPCEATHAMARMEADVQGASENGAHDATGTITKKDVRDALADWKKLITIIFNVFVTLPVAAFSTFMPLIVKGMGYKGVDASIMSMSPFVVAALGLFVFVYLSDRCKERSVVVSSSMMLAVIGLVVMYSSSKPKLQYGFAHVCLTRAFTAAGNTPKKAKRSIIIGMNGYSSIAGVIAGQLYKSKYAPRCTYRYLLDVFYDRPYPSSRYDGVDCNWSLRILRVLLMVENRRRARIISSWTPEDYEAESHTDE
ncbi:major facilitator superfamily domain-containing protein [Phaeosphaeriaceae sp. PMI808]|nr:major facilitator superfamily domain-containing protein [Phaeosphaeriaceae sp. PMI808]